MLETKVSVQTSIVIRTLNEAKHLGSLLEGIHDQNYRDWEIILVDSGSTDGTLEIADKYGAHIYHIPGSEFTFGRSLNLGCSKAEGDYLVFASGHVWPITNNWLRNLVRPFDEPSVAMVYGRQRATNENRLSEQRDLYNTFGETSTILVDEPKGNNGNAAVRRVLWLNQPFDESLTGLEDIDWARKAQRKGYRVYYAADAAVHHVHEETLKQVYRRYYREAKAANHMFPHYRFSKWDLVRGLPYFIARDVLFALKHGKFSKLLQIPATRAAYFCGHYNGINERKDLSREALSKLATPRSSCQVVATSQDEHTLVTAKLPPLQRGEVLVQIAFIPVDEGKPTISKWSGYIESDSSVTVQEGWPFSGVVIETAKDVRTVQKGSRVTGLAHPLDRTQNSDPGSIAVAYADYVIVPSNSVDELGRNLSLREGAMVDSLSRCQSAIAQIGSASGKRACVIGAGSLGNLCSQLLISEGLRVTIIDSKTDKLNLLEKYDVDTLTQLDEPGAFDFFFNTVEDRESLQLIDETNQLGAEVIHVGRFNQRDRQKAMNAIAKSAIILEDHITYILGLEDYLAALNRSTTVEHIQGLLCVNESLRTL